jgi:hypothetical protein
LHPNQCKKESGTRWVKITKRGLKILALTNNQVTATNSCPELLLKALHQLPSAKPAIAVQRGIFFLEHHATRGHTISITSEH